VNWPPFAKLPPLAKLPPAPGTPGAPAWLSPLIGSAVQPLAANRTEAPTMQFFSMLWNT